MKPFFANLYIVLRLVFIVTLLILVGYYFFPEQKLAKQAKVDKILIEKSKRKMYAFSNGKMLNTYTISLGFRPKGKKQFEGDGKTPEGKYLIISKNANSIAHKSFGISYPNADDCKTAVKNRKPTGGNIMIHGLINSFWYWGKFHRIIDWTGGCIALTNNEMDDLFKHVDVGCKIEIIK
jgi:murein L,D-transpeptidase YafK